MEINVHGKDMTYIAVLNNELPKALHYTSDLWHRYLKQAAATFNVEIKKLVNGSRHPDADLITDQCSLSFKDEKGNDQLFTILECVENDTTISLSCYNLTLKILNGQAKALSNTVAHSIKWYIEQLGLMEWAGIRIGVNEVSSKLLTLHFDSEETVTARLLSLVNAFDAEFEFVTQLNSDGTLKAVILNLYQEGDGLSTQGVGSIRTDVTLSYGKNVTGVTRTSSKETLFNATTVYDSANKVNWKSLSFTKKNANGDIEVIKKAGDMTARNPISAQMYPSLTTDDGGTNYTRKDFTIEAKDVNTLKAYALSQFAQYAYPELTYDVIASSSLLSADYGLGIGDTIKVQDDNFAGGLLLQARVSEIELSTTNPSNNKLTLSNYVKLQSQVSDKGISQLQALVDATIPYKADLLTDNGTQFKNGEGTTTLTAKISKGASLTETIADSYEWLKDGILIGTGQSVVVDANDVEEKAVYSYQAKINDEIVASSQVTITNVNDGASGKFALETEPIKVEGTSWKYTGENELIASEGTTILPNTEYYFNGLNWESSIVSPENIEENSIIPSKLDINTVAQVSDDLGDMKFGTVTLKSEDEYTGIKLIEPDVISWGLYSYFSDKSNSTATGSIASKLNNGGLTFYGSSLSTTNSDVVADGNIIASIYATPPSSSMANGYNLKIGFNGGGHLIVDGIVEAEKFSSIVDTNGWIDITSFQNGFSGNLKYQILNGVFYLRAYTVNVPTLGENTNTKMAQISGLDLRYLQGVMATAPSGVFASYPANINGTADGSIYFARSASVTNGFKLSGSVSVPL